MPAVGVGIDPFDVRPEARLPAEVERQVHAEAARLRHRIDQPRERRPAGQRVVVALGVSAAAAHGRASSPADARGERRRVQPGGVDDDARRQRHRRCAADLHHDAGRRRTSIELDRRQQGDAAARALRARPAATASGRGCRRCRWTATAAPRRSAAAAPAAAPASASSRAGRPRRWPPPAPRSPPARRAAPRRWRRSACRSAGAPRRARRSRRTAARGRARTAAP